MAQNTPDMAPFKHSETDSAIRRDLRADRAADSFLVRVWYEAREGPGQEPSFRAYIRNLRTGEERFVHDPRTVGEQIAAQLGVGTASGDARRSEPRRMARGPEPA
jgi:hypothetical protein